MISALPLLPLLAAPLGACLLWCHGHFPFGGPVPSRTEIVWAQGGEVWIVSQPDLYCQATALEVVVSGAVSWERTGVN